MKKNIIFIGTVFFILTTALITFAATGIVTQEFINKIKTCTPYDAKFTHPFTGEQMRRKIYGVQNGTCLYKERMPGDMVMVCHYPINMLSAISTYYYQCEKGETFETSGTIGQQKSVKTKINGKEEYNPLQDSFDKGYCDIVPNGK